MSTTTGGWIRQNRVNEVSFRQLRSPLGNRDRVAEVIAPSQLLTLS
jgi:hypothetical protein